VAARLQPAQGQCAVGVGAEARWPERGQRAVGSDQADPTIGDGAAVAVDDVQGQPDSGLRCVERQRGGSLSAATVSSMLRESQILSRAPWMMYRPEVRTEEGVRNRRKESDGHYRFLTPLIRDTTEEKSRKFTEDCRRGKAELR
jgi:hypothetical protein